MSIEMPFMANPKAISAADIYERLKRKIGVIKATQWMFSACPDLGGCSPIEALRNGREDEVRAIAVMLER